MTREEVKAFIKTNFGIEEPTEEMITNFLNTHNKDVQKEKDIAKQYKDKADKADDLQKQLDEIEESKLSESEKASKALEASNNRIAELEKQIQNMTFKNQLAQKGIVGEEAEKLLKADGTLDIETLGSIIADREAKAKAQAEQNLLDKTPDAGSKGGKVDDKPDALTQSVINGLKMDTKASENIISKYI